MPGFQKVHREREYGLVFPASRYDDPRGGRASALERNILRYRAAETALFLFYAEEVRDFMLTTVYPYAVNDLGAKPWEPIKERRLERVARSLIFDGQQGKNISIEDAEALRLIFVGERQQGKKLKVAFDHAIKIGMFTEAEADELQGLLACRNDMAHRIHLVMLDVTRSYWASDHLTFVPPKYKSDALDRLCTFRRSLWERVQGRIIVTLSMDCLLFEFAERVFQEELKRLDRTIKVQIRRERDRFAAISKELDLRGTQLVGDLSPRFPQNHHMGRSYGDFYVPPTGHLTKRGVEICYLLFDLGKSPLAVTYLMGMSLKAAKNRKRGWERAGGASRVRQQVERYDLSHVRAVPASVEAQPT